MFNSITPWYCTPTVKNLCLGIFLFFLGLGVTSYAKPSAPEKPKSFFSAAQQIRNEIVQVTKLTEYQSVLTEVVAQCDSKVLNVPIYRDLFDPQSWEQFATSQFPRVTAPLEVFQPAIGLDRLCWLARASLSVVNSFLRTRSREMGFALWMGAVEIVRTIDAVQKIAHTAFLMTDDVRLSMDHFGVMRPRLGALEENMGQWRQRVFPLLPYMVEDLYPAYYLRFRAPEETDSVLKREPPKESFMRLRRLVEASEPVSFLADWFLLYDEKGTALYPRPNPLRLPELAEALVEAKDPSSKLLLNMRALHTGWMSPVEAPDRLRIELLRLLKDPEVPVTLRLVAGTALVTLRELPENWLRPLIELINQVSGNAHLKIADDVREVITTFRQFVIRFYSFHPDGSPDYKGLRLIQRLFGNVPAPAPKGGKAALAKRPPAEAVAGEACVDTLSEPAEPAEASGTP